VVNALEEGATYDEVAERFGVGRASVSRWYRQWRSTKDLTPRSPGGSTSPLDEEDAREVLQWLVDSSPDATLAQLVDGLFHHLGLRTNDSSVCEALKRMGITRKKKSFVHNRRLDDDVIAERSAFVANQPNIDVSKAVFIDESGVNLSMTPTYGRAVAGKRVYEHRPSSRTEKTSLAGAISVGGLIDVHAVSGSYNTKNFLQWLNERLLPKLASGSIIIWDNIRFHANKLVIAAVRAAGCTLVKMPPYSPDLNPIEEAWSKVKHFVRAARARTADALRAAVADAARRVTASDALG
jgi:transposase